MKRHPIAYRIIVTLVILLIAMPQSAFAAVVMTSADHFDVFVGAGGTFDVVFDTNAYDVYLTNHNVNYVSVVATNDSKIWKMTIANTTPLGTYSFKIWHAMTTPTVYTPFDFTLTVTQAPVAPTQITPLTATVTAGGSTTLTADGSPAPTFSLGGAVPAGVTISPDGTLSVAQAVSPGTYTFDVTATNSAGNVTQTMTLTVTQAPITPVAPTQIAPLAPTVAAGGSATLMADGYPAPTFSLGGTVPAGVTISPDGMLSVAQSVAPGTYTFDVTATNSAGSITLVITLTVTPQSIIIGGGSYESEPAPRPDYEKAVVIKVREWANVRSGPGTNYSVVGRVYLGEQIELLEWNKDETWCKILYSGGNSLGWLHYRFIKPVQ